MFLASLMKNTSLNRNSGSETTLPTLSLNELEKNYLLLRQKKQNKNPHHQSETKLHSNLETNILVKSPFYDRSKCTNKHTCRCQYHKKIRFQAQRKYKQKKQFQFKDTIPRLKTLNDQSLPKSVLSQKRVNSMADQVVIGGANITKDSKYFENLISKNQKLYKQFLEKISAQKRSNVDCYNHEFDRFLMSHGKWMLHDVKNLGGLGRLNATYTKGQNSRFLTAPSAVRKSSAEEKEFQNSKDKYADMNPDDIKRDRRKKAKQNTQALFFDNQERLLKNKPFISFLEGMSIQERGKFEGFFKLACKEIGLDYAELKTQTLDNTNFFTTILKHLADQDDKVVQKAMAILRKLSKLPIEIYTAIMKQMNAELSTNFDPITKTFEPKSDMVEESVCLAFETIEDTLGEMMKNNEESRGKEKLTILGKLKYKYVGRNSISYPGRDSKTKIRLSNSNSPKNRDEKRSRFASLKNDDDQGEGSEANMSQSDQYSDTNDTPQESIFKPGQGGAQSKQKRRSLKKGHNMLHKMKKDNIMKIIDEEIELENSKNVVNVPKKTANSVQEEEYLRERKESRKRLREEELNKHMEFLKQMKEKEIQRVSSTMSECEMKKNTARAHYQRHKGFLKKMEASLINHEALKDMIINYDDDLFTKKRKVRILKNMIIHELPEEESESQFCRDMHRYIDIFEKNCQLVIGKNNWGRFKKYAKRKGDSLFENSYLEKCGLLETPPEMCDLIQLLRSDHNLKFYNVAQICFEEEEYFSLIKQIPTFTTETFSNHTSKRQQTSPGVMMDFGRGRKSDILEQTDMETRICTIRPSEECEEEEEEDEGEGEHKEEESRDLRLMKERFNRNMEKYQRIFRADRFTAR